MRIPVIQAVQDILKVQEELLVLETESIKDALTKVTTSAILAAARNQTGSQNILRALSRPQAAVQAAQTAIENVQISVQKMAQVSVRAQDIIERAFLLGLIGESVSEIVAEPVKSKLKEAPARAKAASVEEFKRLGTMLIHVQAVQAKALIEVRALVEAVELCC